MSNNKSRSLRLLAVFTCMMATPLYTGAIELTTLPQQIDYVCANNRTLSVVRSPDARRASVLVNGNQVILLRTDSAAQEKYSDGRYTLYLEGEKAMLEDISRVLFGPCQSPVPLPTHEHSRW